MAQTLDFDTNAVGGGGWGGMGGFGSNNPLLWLITLGFLRGNDGVFGGNNNAAGAATITASENSAKIDCLTQGQQSLSRQIESNSQQGQFAALSAQVDNVAGVARDSRDLFTTQTTALAQSLAECCCELRTGQQSIKTDIAMQTATLDASGLRNTQAILDKLCENQAALKDAEIRRLQDALQTQTILANCGSNGNGGVDVNLLLRQIQNQGQGQAT